MTARKPALDVRTLRHCARVLRLGADVNAAWAAQPGTSKRSVYGLECGEDDLRVHADSFDIAARRIERAKGKKR